jgi:hypothetical protein
MNCFYVPGSRQIIDTINARSGKSSICGESLEQVQERYPGAEVWDIDIAFKEIQRITYAEMVTAPQEISRDRFDEMLNVLPPMNWHREHNAESFMICEATSLDLHSIFCRIGNRYFEMTNRRSLTHQEIIAVCSA